MFQLHAHDMFSQLDGFGSAEDYAKQAKRIGLAGVALTNHGNIDGLIQWQKAFLKAKVDFVLGCEAYIVPDLNEKNNRDRWHITLLVKNQKGWENLCKMMTVAWIDGFYYKPRIDARLLLNSCRGLVIMTGCVSSFLNMPGGKALAKNLIKKIGGDFYYEVMPHPIAIQKKINKTCLILSKKTGRKIVATNDCHYVKIDDAHIQEVMMAIQTSAKWDNKDRFRFSFKGLHLRSRKQMVAAFKRQHVLSNKTIEQAIDTTLEIGEKCKGFRIEKKEVMLPDVLGLNSERKDKRKLLALCMKGYRKRFGDVLSSDPVYYERFREEFSLLESKRFIRYFLMVWDLVYNCGKMDVLVGPGRGSVGGSLVAYLLGITLIDPIKWNLIFARFISEARIDLPDIDLDFEDIQRERAKKYLEEKYGYTHVAGITTYSRMQAKNSVRDVARVFGIPDKDVNPFAKLIENTGKNKDISELIDRAIEDTSIGKSFQKRYPEVIRDAKRIAGQIRNYGQHAAAVVISPEELQKSYRGHLVERKNHVMINWDKEDAEFMGLIKLDTLGLSTLTVLNKVRKLALKNGSEIDFEKINLDDSDVFEEINNGNNVGVFQLNSSGMIDLCKRLGIHEFEDIVAANALYRPGPLRSGMADEFVSRKKGKRVKHLHPKMKDITSKTFGIVLYQEQVMFAMRDVAGMTWKEADKVRKIMGKSKGAKEFRKFKQQFVKGCVKNKTLKAYEAEKLWKDLESFGGYGFNRSHAVAYSMISYWTAWCKKHYPVEFICASLTYGLTGEKKKRDYQKKLFLKEAMRLGLKVVLPKVAISDAVEWTSRGDRLFVPFAEVKGLGPVKAYEASKYKKPEQQKKLKGFFNESEVVRKKKKESQLEKILREIGAFDPGEIAKDSAKDYFSFDIFEDYEGSYRTLFSIADDLVTTEDVGDLLTAKKIIPGLISRKRKMPFRTLSFCKSCGLYKQATKPVPFSPGIYNVAILGEAPGPKEDFYLKGFHEKAPAGSLLWEVLGKKGLKRALFHVTNICKCYPSKTKTPTIPEIEACTERWLMRELSVINCRLILAFGNTSVKFLTGEKSGISRLSGNTEWIEKVSAYVCWCVHPAAVKRNPANKEAFMRGIDNFADVFKRMKARR